MQKIVSNFNSSQTAVTSLDLWTVKLSINKTSVSSGQSSRSCLRNSMYSLFFIDLSLSKYDSKPLSVLIPATMAYVFTFFLRSFIQTLSFGRLHVLLSIVTGENIASSTYRILACLSSADVIFSNMVVSSCLNLS